MAVCLIAKHLCDHCCFGVDQLIGFGDIGVVCNAAFTSCSRPSEDTLYSLGNLPHSVQVQLSYTFLSLRWAALTLNAPSVVNHGIKSWLGLKSPHWPDVLAPLCCSICVVPHWGTTQTSSAVVTAVASSKSWNTKLLVEFTVSPDAGYQRFNASIGLTSSSCNSLLIPVPHYSSLCTGSPTPESDLVTQFFSFWCLNLFELLVKIFFFYLLVIG